MLIFFLLLRYSNQVIRFLVLKLEILGMLRQTGPSLTQVKIMKRVGIAKMVTTMDVEYRDQRGRFGVHRKSLPEWSYIKAPCSDTTGGVEGGPYILARRARSKSNTKCTVRFADAEELRNDRPVQFLFLKVISIFLELHCTIFLDQNYIILETARKPRTRTRFWTC